MQVPSVSLKNEENKSSVWILNKSLENQYIDVVTNVN